jgi:N-acetylglucosamine repressor
LASNLDIYSGQGYFGAGSFGGDSKKFGEGTDVVSTGKGGLYPGCREIDDLRRHNRALVLELIRTRGPVSRAELARVGRLGIPAVVGIVEKLMQEGLVKEVGPGPSTGGRRPILLELVPEAHCAVGLGVGTRTLTAVATDLNAAVKKRLRVSSEMARGPEALMERVRETLREVLRGCPNELGEVLGIGMALPAPVLEFETSAEVAFSPPSYPGWGELRIGDLVEEEFGLPVLLDNDANAAALGEHLYGAGQGARDMFYLIAHRGIGGAVIMDGMLHRGSRGGAGEIGHTLIDLEGPRCGCGRYGCLEAFAGRAAIARRASRAMKLAGGRDINGRNPDEVTAEDVIEAGLGGDELARRILEETGEYLGVGISNAVNLFDPEVVVVGGSTVKAGPLILDPAIEVMRRRALPGMAEQVRVVAGTLGEDAGAVGAAALVLRSLFAISVPDEEERSLEKGTLVS